jgi:antitoxin (DNA-binding transcriptional repressor) of toxin-antitoxin stability system
MNDLKLSVTEAARNFSDCVNRARYQNASFLLLKSGSPVARITPCGDEKVCTGAELAAVLRKLDLGDEESAAWLDDLKRARESIGQVESRWE